MARAARATPQARNRSGTSAPTWSCVPCGGVNPDGTRYCGHCGVPTTHATVVDEHRLITALFADISGFTTLADSLDTAALHRVISPVIGVLTGVAERYEGTIAKYAGDAVLVFFGAPVAVEDHADRALSCALDMHRALAEALPRLPEEAAHLKLHVGVNTGRVIAGMFGGDLRADYSILGDAVNVAQRLESVASPGETYVGELTHQLAAASFELEDLGGLNLKGKPEPVPAWRLVRDRRDVARVVTRATSFVGRRFEFDLLQEQVRQLAAGRGGLATVVAEPGSGKSRLVEEVHACAAELDCDWLEARSISYGASVPYWPFVDLLRRRLGIRLDLDPDDAARRLRATFKSQSARAASLVARLLGVPMPDSDDVELLSPEAFNRELSDTLATWVAERAKARPTVLVVEDLHWIDSASADLLARITRLLASSSLLVVLSGRPEGESAVQRLANLTGDRVVALRLGPLDEQAVAALVEEMLGAPVADDVVATVVERTGGNPFFAQELVRALRDDEVIDFVDGAWSLTGDRNDAVPLTVEGVISARIDRLPMAAAQVLLAASVVGRRVDLALLDGVTELGGHLPRLVDALIEAALLDRVVVEDTEVVRFHHALVVDVAYGRLVDRQRRQLHRRVAETAEVLYGSGDDVIDLLARHFYLADAGVKAVDHLERAAARARSLYANDQAISHLRCAVELSRRTEKLRSRLPRLLVEVGEVELLVSAYEDASRDYSEARDLSGDVRAWCGLSAVQRKWGRYDDAIALVDAALRDGAFEGEDAARVWHERAAALINAGRIDEVTDSAMQGLAMLANHDGAVAGELLLRIARAYEMAGDDENAYAYAANARDVLEKVGDQRALALAYRIMGGVLQAAERYAEAEAVCRLGLRAAERTGNAEEVAGCLINLGLALFGFGRLEEAVACDERALALFEHAGNVLGECTARCNLGEKLLECGDVDSAIEHSRASIALAAATGFVLAAADANKTLAAAYVRTGDIRAATDCALESSRLFESLGDIANADKSLALLPVGATHS